MGRCTVQDYGDTIVNFIAAVAAVFFIVMISVGIVFSLTGEYVHPADFHKAEEVCAANGGVKELELDVARVDVTCNNGAMFDVPKSSWR